MFYQIIPLIDDQLRENGLAIYMFEGSLDRLRLDISDSLDLKPEIGKNFGSRINIEKIERKGGSVEFEIGYGGGNVSYASTEIDLPHVIANLVVRLKESCNGHS